MSRTLQEYHEIADTIAHELPLFVTANPFLTKEDFDKVIEKCGVTLSNSERWWVLGNLEGKGVVKSTFGTEDVQEIYLVDVVCTTCHKRPGRARSDNGLPAGIHCDDCWEDIVGFCRQRSW